MTNILKRIDDTLLTLIWSLWGELGVASHIRNHKQCMVSLEELIILTALLAEVDPRLRDEALDWCYHFHSYVSISRLRTLINALDESVYGPISLFAATLNSMTQSNWPVLVKVSPLNITLSCKSKPPSCQLPALLNLRLRKLYGVGARADLLTLVMTQGKTTFTASEAVDLGYNKKTIANILDNFVDSGFFTSIFIGNKKEYNFIKINELKRMIGALPNIVPPWFHFLKFVLSMRNILQSSNKKTKVTNSIDFINNIKNIETTLKNLNLFPPAVNEDLENYWDRSTAWVEETIKAYAQANFKGEFIVPNNFEEYIYTLMQRIYQIQDDLDGLEVIVSESRSHMSKQQIILQAYNICLIFINELDQSISHLLEYPYYKLMDYNLSEIIHNFTLNKSVIFNNLHRLPSTPETVRSIILHYETVTKELDKIHNFIHLLTENIKKIYYKQTFINLLTLSDKLHKRHVIRELFSA